MKRTKTAIVVTLVTVLIWIFAEGESLLLPRTAIDIDQGGESRMALVEENVTLADLVDGLNALGVGPRDMIDILKAIKAAGALHAELLVQ